MADACRGMPRTVAILGLIVQSQTVSLDLNNYILDFAKSVWKVSAITLNVILLTVGPSKQSVLYQNCAKTGSVNCQFVRRDLTSTLKGNVSDVPPQRIRFVLIAILLAKFAAVATLRVYLAFF
jgi:hypothetical protein